MHSGRDNGGTQGPGLGGGVRGGPLRMVGCGGGEDGGGVFRKRTFTVTPLEFIKAG